MATTSTIAALASPPGGGARGVIRLSGPQCAAIVRATCRFDDAQALACRGAFRARFDDGVGTQPALVLWMPGPRSYTREDVAELHLVGSPPLLDAALRRVLELGARVAQAGEFTRRAFESGRIDLTRAEGVLALVEAATEGERRAATALLFGGLAERVAALRAALLDLRVACEASLDFDVTDTGHVPHAELTALAARARAALDDAAQWEARRARAEGLPRVVLAGAPNAGKSTLFNALSGGRALVDELAGTTRDVLRAPWTVAGVACELYDTAGLSPSAAERADPGDPGHAAQGRARAEHASADLLVWVVDARARDAAALQAEFAALPAGPSKLLAWSQTDRVDAAAAPPPQCAALAPWVATAALRGRGLAELGAAAAERLGLGAAHAGAGRELSARHLAALRLARERLEEAGEVLSTRGPLDLVAEGVRAAADALDELDGRTCPEDVLDQLFARFCIGK